MAKAASNKKAPSAKAPSKSEMLNNISAATGVARKEVAAVLDALSSEIKKCLKGPGVVQIPGLVKISKVKKPAQPARKGVMVLGQLRDIPAKPASTKVRVRPLKGLKEMV
jgi:nucleoid DNA-binding protein